MDHTKRNTLAGVAGLLATAGFGKLASAQTSGGAGQPVAVALKARVLASPPGPAGVTGALSLDGSAAGPVLRIKQGQTLAVTLANSLEEPLALQWDGLREAASPEVPGPGASADISPGKTATIRIAPPEAGLFWFHAAAMPGRSDQTGRGLRGVLVVEEAEPPTADLDHLVTLADWVSAAKPAELSQPEAPAKPGPITANGEALPDRATIVSGGRLRLRVLNASTTRIMLLGIDGARPMIVAIDGQPSDLFEPIRDMVPVGPGARFEFMIDMPRDPGAAVKLILRGSERVGGVLEADRVVFEAKTDGIARAALPAIAALPANPKLPPAIPLERSVRADLVMERLTGPTPNSPATWRLNGVASDSLPARPLLTVKPGGTVTLGLSNLSSLPVALRIQGQAMRLLHPKDDGWEPYWRDSVLLPPKSTNHVAFVADRPGKWLIESGLYDQAAFGLRTWFLVG